MEILKDSNEIREALKETSPEKIAVAYIGTDYNEFIKTSKIKHIILSTDLGTNPFALENLSNKIGWNKVHLLDNLHAKIYIGKSSYIITSANLTKNGLLGNRLIEVGVKNEKDESINKVFAKLLGKSRINYPNKKNKICKLEEMKRKYLLAIRNKIISAPPIIKRKRLNNLNVYSDFVLCPYDSPIIDKIINPKEKFKNEGISYNKNDQMYQFHKGDNSIKKGNWLLRYYVHNNEIKYCKFMFCDNILIKVYKDCNLAIESKDNYDIINSKPFPETGKFLKLFNEASRTKKFRFLKDLNSEKFNDNDLKIQLLNFIKERY